MILKIIRTISVVLMVLIVLVSTSLLYRRYRTEAIYNRHASLPYNIGAKYIYNHHNLNLTPMLWGINRTELRFLIQNSFRDISDLRYPALVEFNYESEDYLNYSINDRNVFFYFNSDGVYYKAVEKFPSICNISTLFSFTEFNTRSISKRYLMLFRSDEERFLVASFESKWKCDSFESGFVSTTGGYSFLKFNRLINEIPFDDYPKLEMITAKWEFGGMLIENRLWPNPDNPYLLMRELVFTSTYLSGD